MYLKTTVDFPESELSSDLLSIITVFSARIHGLWKYRNKIKKDSTLLTKEFQLKMKQLIGNTRIILS